jgi:DNA-binding transcriptional MerR regulator
MVFQERHGIHERHKVQERQTGPDDAHAPGARITPQAGAAIRPALWAEPPRKPEAAAEMRALASIGDVARRFGITLRALRFYESKGLIHPLRDGHVRYCGPRDLVRIELILKGKQLGFTLAEIISMLGDGRAQVTELMFSAQQALAQIRHLERQHRSIEEALADLRKRYYLMSEPATR